MATYLIHWKANPDNWPSDPKEVQAVWDAVAGGGDMMLANGGFTEIRWISNTSGYCIAECDSKAEALAVCTPFFPYFSQTIEETVPWEAGRDAVLEAARQGASGEPLGHVAYPRSEHPLRPGD